MNKKDLAQLFLEEVFHIKVIEKFKTRFSLGVTSPLCSISN